MLFLLSKVTIVSLERLTPGSDLLVRYFIYFLREFYLTVAG